MRYLNKYSFCRAINPCCPPSLPAAAVQSPPYGPPPTSAVNAAPSSALKVGILQLKKAAGFIVNKVRRLWWLHAAEAPLVPTIEISCHQVQGLMGAREDGLPETEPVRAKPEPVR